MAQSYSRNIIHAVFSTKGRRNLIPDSLEPELAAYLVGVGKSKGIPVIASGGTANHLHIVFGLPATQPLSSAMNKLKSNSSRWMSRHVRLFEWQRGYGAFGVSSSQLPAVLRYVSNQKEHHKRRSFEQEFLLLLKRSGIVFDPATVFD